MASPPFSINQSLPGDSDIVSQHPANARTFRDVVESWLLVEHNVQGRHDRLSLDDQGGDQTIAADVVGIWNDGGVLKTRNGIGAVTEIPQDKSLYALLASPVFTGNPTAPTPSAGDNDTSIATTAFVVTALTAHSPIAGGFRGLEIKNNTGTPNTQIDVDAEAVTVETTGGLGYRLSPIDLTINCATTGANALDAGGLANNTWYSVWVIYNPSTATIAGLASTSATSPTMPSGYTAKARLGWMRTDGSAVFRRTIQKGRRVQYVGGSRLITDSTGGTASLTSPTLTTLTITDFVPTTASFIHVGVNNGGNGIVMLAPTTAWGGANNGPEGSNDNVYPHYTNASGASVANGSTVWIMLETTSIAYAANSTAFNLGCLGWEDNI